MPPPHPLPAHRLLHTFFAWGNPITYDWRWALEEAGPGTD